MTSEISKFKVLETTDMQTENVILPVPMPGKEKELTEIFYFNTLCRTSKGFMKAFKALIKLFEAPQRSVKTKI